MPVPIENFNSNSILIRAHIEKFSSSSNLIHNSFNLNSNSITITITGFLNFITNTHVYAVTSNNTHTLLTITTQVISFLFYVVQLVLFSAVTVATCSFLNFIVMRMCTPRTTLGSIYQTLLGQNLPGIMNEWNRKYQFHSNYCL